MMQAQKTRIITIPVITARNKLFKVLAEKLNFPDTSTTETKS